MKVRLTDKEMWEAVQLGEARWEAIRGRWPEKLTEEMVAARAKEIDAGRFVSFFSFGNPGDPYGFLDAALARGEIDPHDVYLRETLAEIGRIWWVFNPDDDGFPVAARDVFEAHPEITWDEIYAREEKWSRDTDPFHGIFR
jgi:hypothetical protein